MCRRSTRVAQLLPRALFWGDLTPLFPAALRREIVGPGTVLPLQPLAAGTVLISDFLDQTPTNGRPSAPSDPRVDGLPIGTASLFDVPR
jgi:hypothetical protein